MEADPYSKLQPGDLGVVKDIDDLGGIRIKWRNGEGLAALWGVDVIKRVPD
jgi:hypothetical protein